MKQARRTNELNARMVGGDARRQMKTHGDVRTQMKTHGGRLHGRAHETHGARMLATGTHG